MNLDYHSTLLIGEIKNIIIVDNGIGFNSGNYDSFNESDSIKKVDIGGKGIGRFTYLKVFEKVEISSTYTDNKNNIIRVSFDFVNKNNGIENYKEVPHNRDEGTTIKLVNLKNKYKDSFPKKISTISESIVEHFLSFFLSPNFPNIIIHDQDDNISVQDVFDENYSNEIDKYTLEESEIIFFISFIKKYKKHNKKHEIHFCADNRKIKTIELNHKNIAGLHGSFEDDSREFYSQFYIFSDYLNENANQERTSFSFEDDEKTLFNLSFNDIRLKIIDKIKEEISNYLIPIKKKNRQYIDKYIEDNAPQYSVLKPYGEHLLEEIHDGLTKLEIDNKLFSIKRKVEVEIKEEIEYALYSTTKNINEYTTNLSSLVHKINNLNQSNLSDYVIHRKTILTLLEKFLTIDENGKYFKENAVHDLIAPMNKDSTEIGYNHNLWLIDEKLSYHTYMSSDKALNEIIDNGDRTRPDLLLAFSDDKDNISSITIFELKRPMRNEYPEDENPITQVQNYIEKIQNGKVLSANGRPLNIQESTPFYAYIICDITPKIISYAKKANLTRTPDGKGYYDYQKSYNAYFEIISFDKLIKDANIRNQILFDKLGLF